MRTISFCILKMSVFRLPKNTIPLERRDKIAVWANRHADM